MTIDVLECNVLGMMCLQTIIHHIVLESSVHGVSLPLLPKPHSLNKP